MVVVNRSVPGQERRYSEIVKPRTAVPPDPDMIAGSSLSGIEIDPPIEVAAKQSARNIVQSILTQILLHDSPPINEEVNTKFEKHRTGSRVKGITRQQQPQPIVALSCPSESSMTSSESETLRSASIDHDDTIEDNWKAQNKLQRKVVEMKMGHGALATLCQRTLECTALVTENEENMMPQQRRFKPNLKINTNIVVPPKIVETDQPPLLGESLLPLSPLAERPSTTKRESFGDPPALDYTSQSMANEGFALPTPATARSFDEIRQMPSDSSISQNHRSMHKDPPLVQCRDATPTFERRHDIAFEEDLPFVHSLSTEDDSFDYPPQYPEIMRAHELSEFDQVYSGLIDILPGKSVSHAGHVPRYQMFGSEYARFLSETPLAPNTRNSKVPTRPPRHNNVSHRQMGLETARTLTLESANDDVKTGAITDIVVTRGSTLPPKGYYRISQGFLGDESGGLERIGREIHINVKKEPKWDRAAQRPCVTAITVIFPDRKEFVPPGFCVVSFYDGGECARVSKLGGANPADLYLGLGTERVYLCYRRSREGNPLTGLTPLLPSRCDPVPEGYTVLERSPRNHVAALTCSGNTSVFLAFRQRLATLEPLRPLPLLLSIYRYAVSSHHSPMITMEHLNTILCKVRLSSYYCTGGTTVSSNVGKFHIMDRSTHALLSPSSIQSRLALIQASRTKAGSCDGNSTLASSTGLHYSLYPDEMHIVTNTFSGSHSIQTNSDEGEQMDDDGSLGTSLSILSSSVSHSIVATKQLRVVSSSTLFANDDVALQHCLNALAFIPPIESPPSDDLDPTMSLELRTALLTPILTACYTHHGGALMLALKGLDSLLNRTDFFRPDISSAPSGYGSEARLTLLDIAIQSVCDIATSTSRETSFVDCIEFVEKAVSYSRGHLNGRTIGYVLRFYLFVFYFGASVPSTSTSPNTVWPTLSHQGNSNRSSVATKDVPFLFEVNESDYRSGGAPQAAVLALKHMVTVLINRLIELSTGDIRDTELQPEADGSDNGIDGHVEHQDEARRVDMANFAQLALHQIHRSGGSELFWYDMMTCCGSGLFDGIKKLGREGRSTHLILFSLLANLIKSSSGRMRQLPTTGCLIPRDVSSKMLSLEMLHHYVTTFRQCALTANLIDGVETVAHQQACGATLIYAMRRLVAQCLLANSVQGFQDSRVYRRLIQIISEMWNAPMFRKRMKLELGLLMDHFALRLLNLGPQLLSPKQVILQTQDASESTQATDSGMDCFTEALFNQQVDLLFELKKWFQGDARRLVEFFLNFDTDISLESDEPSHLMPGSQLKLCEQLCGAICLIAIQSGNIIADQINESRLESQGPPSVAVDEDFSKDTAASHTTTRVASRQLQECSFAAAVQVARSLAIAAATAAGPVETKVVIKKLSGDKEICFDGDAYEPMRKAEHKSASVSSRDGNQSILSYWRSAIAAERKRGTTQKAYHGGRQSKSDSQSRGGKDGDWEFSSTSESANEETLRAAFLIVQAKSLKHGIEYLIQKNFLSPSPGSISTFLRVHNARLDPKSLGEYLGVGGADDADIEFFNLVRFNYVRAISFVGMTVEQGLRHFLTNCGFRLPGEAQQIDRVMTTFSQCYWEDNAGDYYRCPFDDQDTVFLLSFAIIMLNTDLHKQSIPTKYRSRRQRTTMTKAEFLSNLRDVARDDALSHEYLSAIYDSVEACPIELLHEPLSNSSAVKSAIRNDAIEGGSFAENFVSMLKNVKKSEELLRSLSVHEFRFYSIEDYADYNASSKIEALMDLSHSAFACTWVYFHRLIKATVNKAHLDPQGLVLCLPLLHHCLDVTICLGMTKEFRSFVLHLARLKTFAENSSIAAPSYHSEEWYSDLNAALEQRDKATALEHVQELMEDLEEKLKIDSYARKKMSRVAHRIREGQFLLNDPTRFFRKEGFLLKKSHRMGRSARYHFFLFSDILLYAKAAVVTPGTELYYVIHEVLALPTMTIVDWFPGSKKSTEKSFSIHHPRKSFTVVCDTVDERQGWVVAIRKCIRNSQRRMVQLAEARKNTAESQETHEVQAIAKPSCL